MLRKCLLVLVAAAASMPLCALQVDYARTYELTYRVAPEPTSTAEMFLRALGKTSLRSQPRPEELKHPEYASKSPVFVQVPVRGSNRFRWAALDTGEGSPAPGARGGAEVAPKLARSLVPAATVAPGPPPDRLYLDTDGDMDLTDEEPLQGRPLAHDPGPLYVVFPPIAIGAVVAGEEVPYHVRIAVPPSYASRLLSGGTSYRVLRVAPVGAYAVGACYYEGRIELGGKPLRMALLDTNVDGRFDERAGLPDGARAPTRGDGVVLSEQADEPVVPAELAPAKRRTLGRYLPFDGQCYQIRVSPAGTSVKVYAAKPDMGIVKAKQATADVQLANRDGVYNLQTGAAGACVPVGTYQVLSCTLHQTDDRDREWALTCYPADAGATAVEVKTSETTELPVGPPLLWSLTVDTERKVVVRSVVRAGREPAPLPAVYLAVRLAAQGGMRVSGMTVDGERPPKPKLKITDAAGKVVHEATFEYG